MNDNLDIELLHDSQISQLDNFVNFKIIIIGDSGVGKSSLLKRAVKNSFDNMEMYRSLVQGFYHNSSLAIIVYNVNDKNSFYNISVWLKDLRQHTDHDLPVFLVGNKSDLEKEVPFDEANSFSKNNNMVYFTECSAKTGYNIKEIFFEAAKQLYHIYNKLKSENKLPSSASKLKIDKNDNKNNNDGIRKLRCCK